MKMPEARERPQKLPPSLRCIADAHASPALRALSAAFSPSLAFS
jgi:hypothetical protein